MKLAIPTDDKKGLNSSVADHFGRCKTYTFINEKGDIIGIIENTSEHMGGKKLPPELIKKYGVEVLLCKEIGPRAIDSCKKLEIEVYVNKSKTVKEIFEAWKNNKLRKASQKDACKQHK